MMEWISTEWTTRWWLPAAVAMVASAVWAALHRWPARSSVAAQALVLPVRLVAGTVALFSALAVMSTFLVFATNWPRWLVALGAAGAVEATLSAYRLEAELAGRRAGLVLRALRTLIILLVAAMLLQPVFRWSRTTHHRKTVAVLLDVSASMNIADVRTGGERLRLAEAFGLPDAARRFRLEEHVQALHEMAEDFLRMRNEAEKRKAEDRDSAESTVDRDARLDALRPRIKEVEACLETLARLKAEGPKLPDQAVEALTAAAARVEKDLSAPLATETAARDKDSKPEDAAASAQRYGVMSQAAGDVASRLGQAAAAVDDAVYAALSDEQRAGIDALAKQSRLALAHCMLRGHEGRPPVLRFDDHDVKLYTFAAEVAENELDAMPPPDAPRDEPAGTQPLPPPAETLATDLAGGLDRTIADLAGGSLASVLVLSDGRHNAARPIGVVARRLAALGVGVNVAVFGSRTPPTDVSVASVEVPDTIYSEDKLNVSAELKIDGLPGKPVPVSLYRGDTKVDSQTVTASGSSARVRVQLADAPKESGVHDYRLQIEPLDGEVLSTNNERPFTVQVSKDRTRLLLVEGRPRWEFRYLKNLFADRDASVQLQYVLFEPDWVEDIPGKPKRIASATAGPESIEATVLSDDPAEWMKFDVVVLGDVDPRNLPENQRSIINRFVTEAGGTLIVVAGPLHMPNEYADDDLADLLPVTFRPSAAWYVSQPEEQYRIALTAEGRDSIICRQQVEPERNLEVWQTFPGIQWRYPIEDVKPGAAVLAYALPEGAEDYLQLGRAGEDVDSAILDRRREFEKSHALIVSRDAGLGRVLFLAFDRTWRMRYRVGDTHHHKFWGQVLRWAAGEKMTAGSDFIKLGSSQVRYAPGDSIDIRARMRQRDFQPLQADVAVNVFKGEQLLTRRKLTPTGDLRGTYEADLAALPPGRYRLELDCPAAADILQADKIEKVTSEFVVADTTTSELVELAPDQDAMNQLAAVTGGRAVDAVAASELSPVFTGGQETRTQDYQYNLWDSWPLLAAIVALATAEWILRKKAHLA